MGNGHLQERETSIGGFVIPMNIRHISQNTTYLISMKLIFNTFKTYCPSYPQRAFVLPDIHFLNQRVMTCKGFAIYYGQSGWSEVEHTLKCQVKVVGDYLHVLAVEYPDAVSGEIGWRIHATVPRHK